MNITMKKASMTTKNKLKVHSKNVRVVTENEEIDMFECLLTFALSFNWIKFNYYSLYEDVS